MPWADGTVTVDDVADHVGAPVDARMQAAVDVASAYAIRRRSNTDGLVLFTDPTTWDGTVRYAGLLWRSKAATAGFASYSPVDPTDYTEYARALDHIGLDPVVA
jgi:hypothetical protein